MITEYKREAEAGNAIAKRNFGICYFNVAGVPADHREAVKWYKRAAEAENKEAMYNLSNIYEHGEGTAVNTCASRSSGICVRPRQATRIHSSNRILVL